MATSARAMSKSNVTNIELKGGPAALANKLDVEKEHGYIDLTPKRAQILLDHMGANRKLKKHTIARYVRIMTAGNWMESGQPMHISTVGKVMNGQHRCHAVIESGITVRMFIIWDVAPEAMVAMDVGARRQLMDVFSINGEKNTAMLASATRLLWVYKRNKGDLTSYRSYTFENKDGQDLLDKTPKLRQAVEAMMHEPLWSATYRMGIPSLAAFMYYLFKQDNSDLAEKFFYKLATGEKINKGEPVGRLRNRLMDYKSASVYNRPHQTVVAAFWIKAWNAQKRYPKAKLDRLVWAPGREDFPVIE